MFQFDKIRMDYINGHKLPKPIEYGYRLKLDNIETLIEYHKTIHSKLIKQGMDSHLERIKQNKNKKYKREGHWIDTPSIVIDQLASIKDLSGEDFSLLELAIIYEDMLFRTKLEALQRGDILYLTQEGVGTPFGNGMIVKDTIMRPKLIFPKNDTIRIIKWPGGKHFYGKVDGKDVVINGIQKWSNEIEAKRNAKKFLMENNK